MNIEQKDEATTNLEKAVNLRLIGLVSDMADKETFPNKDINELMGFFVKTLSCPEYKVVVEEPGQKEAICFETRPGELISLPVIFVASDLKSQFEEDAAQVMADLVIAASRCVDFTNAINIDSDQESTIRARVYVAEMVKTINEENIKRQYLSQPIISINNDLQAILKEYPIGIAGLSRDLAVSPKGITLPIGEPENN